MSAAKSIESIHRFSLWESTNKPKPNRQMNPHDRTDRLFDAAKRLGLDNPMTDDGAPTRAMVAEAISDAEGDAINEMEEPRQYCRGEAQSSREED
jgi:hypothetical protein